jgi:hypothetical protein
MNKDTPSRPSLPMLLISEVPPSSSRYSMAMVAVVGKYT